MSEATIAPTAAMDERLMRWLERIAPNDWLALGLVALLHVVVALLVFDPTPQANGDNSAYRALAEALASGRGYVRLWEPTRPLEVLYPPVFPLLLAAFMRLGLRSWAALHLVMVLFSTVLVCVAYAWLRQALTSSQAFVCGIVLALSPGLLDASHAVLSDIPFAAFTAVALWAFAALDKPDGHSALRERVLIGVGLIATVVAYFTRSAGLPLLVAVLGWLAWRRRYIAAALLVALVGPLMLAWSARARTAGGANYTDYLRFIDPYQPELGRVDGAALLGRVMSNIASYASRHLPMLLYGSEGGFAALGGWIILLLAVIGYSIRLRRPSVTELWVPLYIGLLLLWPVAWSGDRLLLPLYPVLLAFAALALPLVSERLSRPALLGMFAVGALTLLVSDVQRVRRGLSCSAAYRRGVLRPCVDNDWGPFVALAMSMRGHLPQGSVVLSRKPTIVYAESGYPSLIYPLSTAPDTLLAEAQRVGARYVIADASNLATLYVYDVLRAHPSRFCSLPAFRSDLASLLRIEPERSGAPVAGDTTAIRDCAPDGER